METRPHSGQVAAFRFAEYALNYNKTAVPETGAAITIPTRIRIHETVRNSRDIFSPLKYKNNIYYFLYHNDLIFSTAFRKISVLLKIKYKTGGFRCNSSAKKTPLLIRQGRFFLFMNGLFQQITEAAFFSVDHIEQRHYLFIPQHS